MNTEQREQERNAFEKWFKTAYPGEFLGRNTQGEYFNTKPHTAWKTWQAAVESKKEAA